MTSRVLEFDQKTYSENMLNVVICAPTSWRHRCFQTIWTSWKNRGLCHRIFSCFWSGAEKCEHKLLTAETEQQISTSLKSFLVNFGFSPFSNKISSFWAFFTEASSEKLSDNLQCVIIQNSLHLAKFTAFYWSNINPMISFQIWLTGKIIRTLNTVKSK